MLCLLGLAAIGEVDLVDRAGVASLVVFAWLLTKVDAEFAGRAYAAYGGVYITASVLWMWVVERSSPDRWDVTGLMVCLLGAGIILFAPR